MSAVRTAETRAEMLPEKESDSQMNDDFTDTPEEKEQLYIEVLQTIANSVGAPAPGGQVCIYFLYLYIYIEFVIRIAQELEMLFMLDVFVPVCLSVCIAICSSAKRLSHTTHLIYTIRQAQAQSPSPHAKLQW